VRHHPGNINSSIACSATLPNKTGGQQPRRPFDRVGAIRY